MIRGRQSGGVAWKPIPGVRKGGGAYLMLSANSGITEITARSNGCFLLVTQRRHSPNGRKELIMG